MDHHFKGSWGRFGTDDGEFDRPRGIAIDSDGNVYVADSGNNRIQLPPRDEPCLIRPPVGGEPTGISSLFDDLARNITGSVGLEVCPD
jgi:DNA-binding beta-propeller fold protein YncE